jgi:hypothetical protein
MAMSTFVYLTIGLYLKIDAGSIQNPADSICRKDLPVLEHLEIPLHPGPILPPMHLPENRGLIAAASGVIGFGFMAFGLHPLRKSRKK